MEHPEHHDYDGITEDRERRPPVYFTVLFYGLIIWAVAFCAFYLLSGWSSDAEFQVKMQAHEEKYQSPAAPPAAKAEPADQPAAPPQTPGPATAAGTAATAATAAPAAAGQPDAKALYAGKCAMCHGADGKGGFGSDLTSAAYVYGKHREAIAASITQGRGNGKMPAFDGQLKREEIDALADYLLSLK